MKKSVRYFLYVIILLFFLLQIGVNIFLKNFLSNVVIKNFPNIELRYSKIYYVVPNIIFFNNLSVKNENLELNITRGTIFFNPLSFIFKNSTYVLLSNFDNVFVNLFSMSDFRKSNNIGIDQEINELYVKKIINMLPFKLKIKNGIVNYKKNILVNNFNVDFTRIKEKPIAKINFDVYGYSTVIKFLSNNRTNHWEMDLGISPLVKIFSDYTPEIKGKFFGFYDLRKEQQFKTTLTFANKKIVLKGNFKLFPFLLKGKIFGDIVKGEYIITNTDKIFNVDFDGNIKIKNFFNLEKETEVHTSLKFEKTGTNFKYDFISYTDNFLLKSTFSNNTGDFRFKQKNVNLEAKVNYDSNGKVLNIYSKDKVYPIDIKLSYINDMLLKAINVKGNFSGYATTGTISKVGTELNTSVKIDSKKVYYDILFMTNFSTGTLKVSSKNKVYNSFLKLFSDINYSEKKIHFVFDIKNYLLFNKNVSGLIIGKLQEGNVFLLENHKGNIKIKDFVLDKTKIFDEIVFDYSVFKQRNIIKIFLEDLNKAFGVEASYNISTKYFDALAKINKKEVCYENIKFDLVSDIKIIGKLDNLDLTGIYDINSVFYNNKKVINSISGNIAFKNNKLIFNGFSFINNDKIYYKSIYDIRNNSLDLSLRDIKYDNRNFNIELHLINQDIDQPTIFLTGKIYDKDGVIDVLPESSISLKKQNAILKTKFRNVNFKTISLIGNVDFFVNKKSKEKYGIDIILTNFWLNQFSFDRSIINMLYDSKYKSLIFLDTRSSKQIEDIVVGGEIIFLPTSTEFNNFKINILGERYIFLNGKIGEDKNLLRIEIKNLPIELFKNIFGFSQIQVVGNIISDILVKTIKDRTKKTGEIKYLMKTNFDIKEANFYGFKLNNISGKISILKDDLFLDEITLNFANDQKIFAKGRIDLKNEKIKLDIFSKNSNLSIFNGFADIVKIAQGKFLLNIKVDGDFKSPKMDGFVEIVNGQATFNKYLKNLENIEVRIDFSGNKILIQQFIAKHKNTVLRLVGNAKLPEEYNFKLFTDSTKGLPVSIPELSFPVGQFFKFAKTEKFFASYGEPRINLTFTKKKGGKPKLSGEIILDDTHFTYPPREHVHMSGWDNIFYEIKINSGKNTWYENELISANVYGGITIKNLPSTKGEIVDGEIFSTQGNLNYLGINFKLKNARLQVINSIVYLELLGETDIVDNEGRRHTIQVIVERERIENIKPRLVSINNPQLKSEDIIAILMGLKKFNSQDFFGKEQVVPREGGIDTTLYLRQQIIRLIDSNFATPLVRNILQKSGLIDNVVVSYIPSEEKKISDANSPLTYLKDTKYSFGKYLSDDVLMGYSIILGEEQQKLQLRHEIEISYRLKGNLFLRGAYNFGRRSSDGGLSGSETRIGIEPVWRFGGEKWEE